MTKLEKLEIQVEGDKNLLEKIKQTVIEIAKANAMKIEVIIPKKKCLKKK